MISIGDMDELLCPSCGRSFLHHTTVVVYDRADEDAGDSETTRVRISDRRVEIDHTNQGNPSARRGGLRVELACETCATRSDLTIAQHKGETHVRIEAKP